MLMLLLLASGQCVSLAVSAAITVSAQLAMAAAAVCHTLHSQVGERST